MSNRGEDDKRVARAEEEKDEVEAHRVAMNEEPKAEDDSDDDFEAHSLRGE
jgi:hypothetical protein